MTEELDPHPETEEEHPLAPPQRAHAKVIADILDSATFLFRESQGKEIACTIALVGEIGRDELSGLVEEMPVAADIELSEELGGHAAILFNIPTATRLANFISSGRAESDAKTRGRHISSLQQFIHPVLNAFSSACEEAAGRTFGSLRSITVLDRSEREQLLAEFPDRLVRVTVLINAGDEVTGRMAVALPANVVDLLCETKSTSARITVSPYEQMELEEVDDVGDRPGPYTIRGPSMENIDLILDIQLRLSARLGQVEMPIGEIMKLAPGSVIDIDRLVDEPIELVINDRPIARGEIVVVQENFGIKITEIISQKDRIRSLA
jgi:flagellar motor switch protein FliN/FliY